MHTSQARHYYLDLSLLYGESYSAAALGQTQLQPSRDLVKMTARSWTSILVLAAPSPRTSSLQLLRREYRANAVLSRVLVHTS